VTARSWSVVLFCGIVAAGAAVMAVLHRDLRQAFIAVLFAGLAWLFGWIARRNAALGTAASSGLLKIEPGVLYRGRARRYRLDEDALDVTSFGLHFRIRWDEIVAGRLVITYGQPVIELRLSSIDRLLAEMEPQGQRWRLASVLWVLRTFHGCDLILEPMHLGLDAVAFHEELRSRATT
jgi:hypothetical protein